MEKEFTEWFEANQRRFQSGQFDIKQIAYSAWLQGKEVNKRLESDQTYELAGKMVRVRITGYTPKIVIEDV